MKRLWTTLILLFVLFLHTAAEAAPTNAWQAIGGAGKWETMLNWSQGVPSLNHGLHLVSPTGGFPGTANIDGTTVTSNILNGCLQVSNLTVQGSSGAVSNPATVALRNASDPPGNAALLVLSNLTVKSGGRVTITNSRLRVGSPFISSDGIFNNGFILLNTGELITTNGTANIGDTGAGQMTMLDGTWLSGTANVANSPGSWGTLNLAGGTSTFSTLNVGYLSGATGEVWMTGGQLNGVVYVGRNGVGLMTVSNGTWRGGAAVGYPASKGVLRVVGGSVALFDFFVGPTAPGFSTGIVSVVGGRLSTTNAVIGFAGPGLLIVSNGVWESKFVHLGELAGGDGVLQLAGGTTTITTPEFFLGAGSGGTGTVWMTGGQLNTVFTQIGGDFLSGGTCIGQMIVSGGVWNAGQAIVGAAFGARGTLTVAGGTANINVLDIGYHNNANGAVWITGGELNMPSANSRTLVSPKGRLAISNGTWRTQSLTAGGTLTFAGGNTHIYSNLLVNGYATTFSKGTCNVYNSMAIGTINCSVTGYVSVAGGELNVTNAAGDATLEVKTGSLILLDGTIRVDRIVLTNSCRNFVRYGGTLVYSSAVLTPTSDDDGDRLSNAYELSNGSDPLNPFEDADGDGQSNYAEREAGTNPTNSASFFRITSITRQGTNVLVSWTTQAAFKSYALERASENVMNFSPIFIYTNNFAGGTTSYLDVGAVNASNYVYRVRLLPFGS